MPKRTPARASSPPKKIGVDRLNSVLLRIVEAVHTSDTLQDFFSRIHAVIGELIPVNNFFIAFYERDDAGDEFISFPFFIDQRDSRPEGKYPLRKTLTGYVIRRGVPLLLTPDVYHRLQEEGEVNGVLGTDSCIWLGVPLKIRGDAIGAVVVQSYERSNEYGEREKSILELISGQIAIAVELVRYREKMEDLVRQRTRELEEEKKVQHILFDISQAVYQASGLKDFLAAVHRKVGELMDARNFYIALYDKEIDKYTFPFFSDEYDRIEALQPEDLHFSLTDYVRQHGALLADHAVHRRLISEGQVKGVIGTDSEVWLGVPLYVPGKKDPIGVMTVQSYEDTRRYTEKEKRILMNISTTVAFAIDRIRLVSDMIHHFSNAITSIKGNAELLLAMSEKQGELLKLMGERVQKCLLPPLEPGVAQNREAILEILEMLQAESQSQSYRVGRILQNIDQAGKRVSAIFNPLLVIGPPSA